MKAGRSPNVVQLTRWQCVHVLTWSIFSEVALSTGRNCLLSLQIPYPHPETAPHRSSQQDKGGCFKANNWCSFQQNSVTKCLARNSLNSVHQAHGHPMPAVTTSAKKQGLFFLQKTYTPHLGRERRHRQVYPQLARPECSPYESQKQSAPTWRKQSTASHQNGVCEEAKHVSVMQVIKILSDSFPLQETDRTINQIWFI